MSYFIMSPQVYSEILKIWNCEIEDDFEIYCDLYYQMFSDCYDED